MQMMPLGYDLSSRDWFLEPMRTGALFVSDFYRSAYTNKLILTVSIPVPDANDNLTGVLAADIQLEEMLRRAEELEEETKEKE